MDQPSSRWKSSLSAIDRYEVIQRIQSSLPHIKEAIYIEQTAYDQSSSRVILIREPLLEQEEYDAACEIALSKTAPPHPDPSSSPPVPDVTPGIRIGSYTDCTPVAEGITSEVYRCSDRALKVITAHHSLEPHSPQREVKILRALHHPSCIALLDVFRDQEQRLVLVFPYMPLTLADLLNPHPNTKNSSHNPATLSTGQIQRIFTDTLSALQHIHSYGIIHRDIKPSAILLSSPSGPALLSDFGTAWHPDLSAHAEPPSAKVLDIGTGPYRAPEVLFGNTSYGPAVDMWACGVMLAEALQSPPSPLFESRPVHEDGNQLGLILSIFKTLGTPTPETWPEAKDFKVAPFELWTVFPSRPWKEILPGVDASYREAVAALLRYDGKRLSAEQALTLECFTRDHV